jgi:uncharacterized protein (DUF488 family)
MIQSLYTIGTSGRTLREFVSQLRQSEVDLVIDTRLRNTSHLAGFGKRADLEFLLSDLLAIPYRHECVLAPTAEILDRFRADRDWEAYEAEFEPLQRERDMTGIVLSVASSANRPCLLCACKSARRCHRRLIAEAVAAAAGDLRVEHL